MTIKLENYASSAIQSAIYGKDLKIESADFFDDLRDDASDNVSAEVDNACVYYAACWEIVQRYEGEYGGNVEDTGETFAAEDWQKAMVRYAAGIADAAISALVNEAIDELAEAYGTLCDALPAEVEPVAVMTPDCTHGWAAHAEETAEGVLVWHRLDGDCEARAIQCGAFWLTVTWTA